MLKAAHQDRGFKRSIVLLLTIGVAHTILLLCGQMLPFGALYGPLIYLAFKNAREESLLFSYLHIIPFLFLLFIYALTLFGLEFSVSWTYGLLRFKYVEYYVLIPFSLFLYAFKMFMALKKNEIQLLQKQLLIRLSVLTVLYGLALIISCLQTTDVVRLSFSFQSLLFVFPLAMIILIVMCYSGLGKQTTPGKKTLQEKEIIYGDKVPDEILLTVNYILKEEGLYRNSSISLEMLAERINLPKHQLSHFLNTYLGKSFYQLIAEYRIDYAKKRLKEDSLITIETLAYECGFNSKTSLNKYFKEVTGFAPSQYRLDANQLP